MEKKNLLEMIKHIISIETRYLRVYLGKAVDVNDKLKKGRVLLTVPSLGWDSNDKGVWAFPTDKNSMSIPKIDDWVRIGFLNGNINLPYYFGLSNDIEDMIPTEFDGESTTHILFEDNNDEFFIKYDEKEKVFSTEDSHGNNYIQDSSGIEWTDANGNTIEMSGSVVNVNGNSKSLVTYTELNSAITTFLIALGTHTHSGVQSGGSNTGTVTGAITFNISASESQKIKTG